MLLWLQPVWSLPLAASHAPVVVRETAPLASMVSPTVADVPATTVIVSPVSLAASAALVVKVVGFMG